MKHRSVLIALLAALAAALVGAQAARADAQGGKGVVFVQTNQPTGNQIVVYDRADDGILSPAGTYATGGNGGAALPSGGQFPASVGVHNDLAYVLNSGGTGIVQGFLVTKDGLESIPGSARSLGLANTDPPNFLSAPGQVGFTPDGHQLIVTTKASTSSIDVFEVDHDGLLSVTPVVNPSATPVPFAFTFGAGRLVA